MDGSSRSWNVKLIGFDNWLIMGVVRKRDRLEIVVFYLYMIRRMEGFLVEWLKLGEFGYGFFVLKLKWKNILVNEIF